MTAFEDPIIQAFDILRKILRFVWHYILAIFYMFRKRKVPPAKNPILLMSAAELAKHIREGKLSSESVVQVFIERIVEVEPIINATVDNRFSDALQEAKEADALISSKKMTAEELEIKKPLLGVPFSVKVLLTVKGLRSTAGCVLFKDVRAQEDAAAVSLMKRAGAIVLVTTNSAEVGLNFQTINNLHGTTCNPYDTSKTSGGSSGGESALLAAAGSVIGLGNDIGGSLRIPSMFTGIFAHKPSRGLVSNDGCFPSPTEKMNRYMCTGPMCRYAEDIQIMMKVLSSSREESVKFGKKVDFKDVKICYMPSFDDVKMTEKVEKDILDAVSKVVSHFELNHGSKSKQISIPFVKHSFPIFSHALLSSAPDISEVITAGKEKIHPIRELLKYLCLQSRFTLGYIIVQIAAKMSWFNNPSLVEHYRKMAEQIDDYLNTNLDDISVLVLPTMPFPAPYNYEVPLLIGNIVYCSIFNILGMPGTQCPVGINKDGLPYGVQILSKRDNDYLTIACALEIEKAFGGWKPPN